MRQCPNRYAFRAGQNLPDKEFRYLRTVIVTAAVYRGLNSMLLLRLHLLLTFRHRAGVSSYTSSFEFAETCVFGKQSLGPILCGLYLYRHPFSLSYGVNLPSSLTTLLPSVLGFSPHPPVSVYGTGSSDIHKAFLASDFTCFATYFRSLSTGYTNCRLRLRQSVPLLKSFGGYGISTVCASTTSFDLALAPGLP